jgi:hypothetical protein
MLTPVCLQAGAITFFKSVEVLVHIRSIIAYLCFFLLPTKALELMRKIICRLWRFLIHSVLALLCQGSHLFSSPPP